MDEPEVVEHFFGVYILYCMNPKYRGRTYIGYTVNPRRRIKQHNAGKEKGGAWRTSKKGPWNMVLIVHGFPNSTSALRFEWAWQKPELSRRLRHVPKKKSKQKVFDYRLSVLSEMLKVGPWHRLPLTVRWLDREFFLKYSKDVSPPVHMPVKQHEVLSRSLKKKSPKNKAVQEETTEPEDPAIMICSLCNYCIDTEDRVTCIKPNCHLMAHLVCLAKVFSKDKLLPITGNCPVCRTNILWGDLIRKKIGCNLHLKETDFKADDSGNDSDNFSD